MELTENKNEKNQKVKETKEKQKPISKKIIIISLAIAALVILLVGGFFVWQKGGIALINNPIAPDKQSVTVQATLGVKTASAVLEKTGGSLALEGEKAKYNLNFLDKSLYEKQNVKVQEVTAMTGMGDGTEFLAGIQAGPNGTSLFKPAELTFDIVTVGKKIAAYAYDGNGENFHLVPLFIKNGKATIYLTHFSGYGIINVGNGTYTPPPIRATEEKAAQLIANIIGEARARQQAGDEIGFTENELGRIYNLLNLWYRLRVKPDLDKSVNNENLIELAFDKFNTWKAATELIGLNDKFGKEIEASYNTAAKAVKNAYESAGKKCTESKDATQIAKMTRWSVFAHYWGLNGRSGLNVDDLLEQTKKCAVFELRINSTTSFPEFGIAMNASGSANIGMDSDYNLVGEGVIKQNSLDPQDDFACNYPGGMPSFPVKIVSTKLDVSASKPKTSLILEFDDVDNTLVCNSTLPGVDMTTTSHSDDWLTDYFIIHYDEDYQDPGLFTISDWEILNSGGVYAKKIIDRDKFIDNGHPELNYTLHENTTYELIHKPK